MTIQNRTCAVAAIHNPRQHGKKKLGHESLMKQVQEHAAIK